jgi:hypothetical protein
MVIVSDNKPSRGNEMPYRDERQPDLIGEEVGMMVFPSVTVFICQENEAKQVGVLLSDGGPSSEGDKAAFICVDEEMLDSIIADLIDARERIYGSKEGN